ncbi:MAG: GDSL-type esterase/lipase family protein [Pirellulales bacterium]
MSASSAQTATAPPPAKKSLPPMRGLPESDNGLPGAGPIRRQEWFRDTWNGRRNAWAERGQQDSGALVFFGDSITQGWGDDFGGAFPGVKLANRGISGDTTRGMLVRLDDDVLALDPQGVVMLMGTNDIEEQASPATIAGNIKLIVEKLKEHNPQMPVVLCEVMPSAKEMRRPAATIRELNRLLGELVEDQPQVTLLDTWTLFANASGDAKSEEFPDLLHPNAAGYAKWAKALRPVLATQGLLKTEPDNFVPEDGYENLFNGHDLTGWGLRPTSAGDIKARAEWQASDPDAAIWPIITESTSFDGKTASDNGRFVAKDGRLIVTTPSEGRKIEQLFTEREFPKDFTLKLEFRGTPNADSGIYIRGTQLQCRDYALAGPYTKLKNYKPQDWNEIVVEVKGDTARATCNGEVLEESLQVPATGPIGVEGDRGQMEYRRIRVKEAE